MNTYSNEYKLNIFYQICDDINNHKHTHYEETFKRKFPNLYNELINTKFKFNISHLPFTAQLLLFLKNDINCYMCKCPICGKEMSCKYIDFKHGFHKTCSSECGKKLKSTHQQKSPKEKEITKQKRIQKKKSILLKKYNFDISKINDKEYIHNFLLNFKNPGECFFREPVFKNQFPEVYNNYLIFITECCDEIKNCKTFNRKLYHFFNNKYNMEDYICPVCHKNNLSFKSFTEGYSNTCSIQCSVKTDLFWNNYWKSFNMVPNEERKKMYIERGKKSHITWSKKSKRDIEHRNEKIWTSRKNNKTINTSKIEQNIIKWFSENNINYIHNYKNELYPYHCDFYLPDYNLYIEIQGTWTHGKHPFNINNIDDINTLNTWREKSYKSTFYKSAIENWTIRDVTKRNIAKKNNLNYLEIFSINIETVISTIKNKINIYEF